MFKSTINNVIHNTTYLDPTLEFVRVGQDILRSEDLTDQAYRAFCDLIPGKAGWKASKDFYNKQDFHVSDIGLMYRIGPYIPCVSRISFTRNVDLHTDGVPGIRVIADIRPDPKEPVCLEYIRPIPKLPHGIGLLGRSRYKYKFVSIWKEEKEEGHEALIGYFGIDNQGRIIPSKNSLTTAPEWSGAFQLLPATVANTWADSKYLWLAETQEDIGKNIALHLRFGLSVEHIKSLFYARKLPVTETGRKRPILHWVRAHQRRLEGGIEISIEEHLRGIIEFSMHDLNFRITQPDKETLHRADPPTVKEAFNVYGPKQC